MTWSFSPKGKVLEQHRIRLCGVCKKGKQDDGTGVDTPTRWTCGDCWRLNVTKTPKKK